jgi:hypothetical protein
VAWRPAASARSRWSTSGYGIDISPLPWPTHGQRTGGGPCGYGGWVDKGWVKKNYGFGRNAPQIVIFMVVPPFWSLRNLTGGSSVRGKRTRIGWETFSIVFAPYSIEKAVVVLQLHNLVVC